MLSLDQIQNRVRVWATACFGRDNVLDRTKRSKRFAEESLELLQACGMSREDVLMMVDYVYNRPAGEVPQEIAGAMTTLCALAEAHQQSVYTVTVKELDRIAARIEDIRAKELTKP